MCVRCVLRVCVLHVCVCVLCVCVLCARVRACVCARTRYRRAWRSLPFDLFLFSLCSHGQMVTMVGYGKHSYGRNRCGENGCMITAGASWCTDPLHLPTPHPISPPAASHPTPSLYSLTYFIHAHTYSGSSPSHMQTHGASRGYSFDPVTPQQPINSITLTHKRPLRSHRNPAPQGGTALTQRLSDTDHHNSQL